MRIKKVSRCQQSFSLSSPHLPLLIFSLSAPRACVRACVRNPRHTARRVANATRRSIVVERGCPRTVLKIVACRCCCYGVCVSLPLEDKTGLHAVGRGGRGRFGGGPGQGGRTVHARGAILEVVVGGFSCGMVVVLRR